MPKPIRPNDRARTAELAARGEMTGLDMTAGLVAGALSSVVAEALVREAAAQPVAKELNETGSQGDTSQAAVPATSHDGDGQQPSANAISPDQPTATIAAGASHTTAESHTEQASTSERTAHEASPGQNAAFEDGIAPASDLQASAGAIAQHAAALDFGSHSAMHSSAAASLDPVNDLAASVGQMVERIVGLTGQDISGLQTEISGIADSLAQSVIQASSRIFGEMQTLTQDAGATIAAVSESAQSTIDGVAHLAFSLPPTLLGAANDGILDNSLINIAFGDGAPAAGHQIDATLTQVTGIAAPILHTETGHDGDMASLSGSTDAVFGLAGLSYTDGGSHDGAVGHVSSLLHGLV